MAGCTLARPRDLAALAQSKNCPRGDVFRGAGPMPLSPNAVTGSDPAREWPALMQEIGPRFAQRAGACDAGDHFVAENFSEMKALGVFAAGVPAELGGGGGQLP